jgi:polysaccharide biosynthesis transport protein
MRKLAEAAGSDERAPDLIEKDVLARLYYDLRSQRIRLRLEQAEVETVLERRKKAEGAATVPARAEIAQLEDQLSILAARQRVVDGELGRLISEMSGQTTNALDLNAMKDEIAQLEEAMRKVAAENEAMSVELDGPPRVRIIELAALPKA